MIEVLSFVHNLPKPDLALSVISYRYNHAWYVRYRRSDNTCQSALDYLSETDLSLCTRPPFARFLEQQGQTLKKAKLVLIETDERVWLECIWGSAFLHNVQITS